MTIVEPPRIRVLVTRAVEDARALSYHISRAGYEPVEVPVLQRDWQLDAVIDATRSSFDILLLTSATAASVFCTTCSHWPEGLVVGCVGPATSRRAVELGLPVTVQPERFTAAALLEALGRVDGKVILYPRSALAGDDVVTALRRKGATVLAPIAYTNRPPDAYERQLLEAIPVDATTVLSGSAARRIAQAVPAKMREHLGTVVAIGPSTARAAELVGLHVHRVSRVHTITGILNELTQIFPECTEE